MQIFWKDDDDDDDHPASTGALPLPVAAPRSRCHGPVLLVPTDGVRGQRPTAVGEAPILASIQPSDWSRSRKFYDVCAPNAAAEESLSDWMSFVFWVEVFDFLALCWNLNPSGVCVLSTFLMAPFLLLSRHFRTEPQHLFTCCQRALIQVELPVLMF